MEQVLGEARIDQDLEVLPGLGEDILRLLLLLLLLRRHDGQLQVILTVVHWVWAGSHRG